MMVFVAPKPASHNETPVFSWDAISVESAIPRHPPPGVRGNPFPQESDVR